MAAGDGGRATAIITPITTTTASPRATRPGADLALGGVERRRAARTMATKAITTATTPTAAATAFGPRMGRGDDAMTRATPAIQARSSRVGRCRAAAIGPPMIPAGRPATMPQTMTGPAAGTASRFAGSDASGTPPNTGSSTGATPACAASVTASGAGRPRTSSRVESTAMPAHADTDSRNPTDPASKGSISTSAVAARARMRTEDAGRPSVAAPSASPAIATARSTDGSHLVSTPNATRTTPPTTRRARSDSRRVSGAAMAKMNATF